MKKRASIHKQYKNTPQGILDTKTGITFSRPEDCPRFENCSACPCPLIKDKQYCLPEDSKCKLI
jgi:hypothetical protein